MWTAREMEIKREREMEEKRGNSSKVKTAVKKEKGLAAYSRDRVSPGSAKVSVPLGRGVQIHTVVRV